MITIQTFSAVTGKIHVYGPYDSEAILERFISNKIRQFLRVKPSRRSEGDTLFSYGVLPPVKERNGTFHPAGVVFMKDGMPQDLRVPRFVGTLQSLAEPATYKRYTRHGHENGPK
jgi:hypothetical protein